MTNIVVNHIDEVGREIVDLVEPIIRRWQIAILRVAAAELQPSLLSFQPRRAPSNPARTTAEAILRRRFNMLPAPRRTAAGQIALASLNRRELRTRLGLGNVDLTAAAPVDQLIPLPPPAVSVGALTAFINARFQVGIAGGAAALPGTLTALELQMVRMVCVDETNGFLGSEAGEDEIQIGGAAINQAVDVGTIAPIKLGDFNDWGPLRQKDYSPPTSLFKFDLRNVAQFPSSFFITLVLAEKDQGNFSETVDEIIVKLKEELTQYISGIIIGSVAGGPLGAIIGLAVAYAVGKVIDYVVSVWEDDLFGPRTVEIIVPAANSTFNGQLATPGEVLHFNGPGEYAMRYQWRVTRTQGGQIA